MYKKKKEKKISSKFRRNLKSNLRKKISLQGSSILQAWTIGQTEVQNSARGA